MASRRTRIKAVANFTQRKKAPLSSTVDSIEAVSTYDLELSSQNSNEIEKNPTIIENTSITPRTESCELKAPLTEAGNKIVILNELKIRPPLGPNIEATKVPIKTPISEKRLPLVEAQQPEYPHPPCKYLFINGRAAGPPIFI